VFLCFFSYPLFSIGYKLVLLKLTLATIDTDSSFKAIETSLCQLEYGSSSFTIFFFF